MKFHKRPVDNHEMALAMAVMSCNGDCNCSIVKPCGCPPTPTHQIQYDQTSDGHTIAGFRKEGQDVLRMI